MKSNYESLLELTGRNKGIVEFVDGTVVICDWSPIDGAPQLSVSSMSGSTTPIEVESEIDIPGWKVIIDNASSVINCLGINIESEKDCGARIFNLTDDVSVIVPEKWSKEEKNATNSSSTEKNDGLFCTCKDIACKFHPINHNKGCTPCIENNLNYGEIPSCFINKAGLPRKREGYSIEEFARAVTKQ